MRRRSSPRPRPVSGGCPGRPGWHGDANLAAVAFAPGRAAPVHQDHKATTLHYLI